LLSAEKSLADCTLIGRGKSVSLRNLAGYSSLAGRLDDLHGRSVLIATHDQLTAALALIELDGIARRVVILPPGVEFGHLAEIIAASSPGAT